MRKLIDPGPLFSQVQTLLGSHAFNISPFVPLSEHSHVKYLMKPSCTVSMARTSFSV